VKGFRLNSAYGLPNQGFSAGIAPRDICFCVFGSSEFPNAFKEKQDSQTQKSHRNTSTRIKSSLFIADNQTFLVQSNQKACLAQTGDE
jgi:hypothetical protein